MNIVEIRQDDCADSTFVTPCPDSKVEVVPRMWLADPHTEILYHNTHYNNILHNRNLLNSSLSPMYNIGNGLELASLPNHIQNDPFVEDCTDEVPCINMDDRLHVRFCQGGDCSSNSLHAPRSTRTRLTPSTLLKQKQKQIHIYICIYIYTAWLPYDGCQWLER